MATDLTTTMDTLTECVCAALEEIDRAVCACGLTVGPPATGPAGCCECNNGAGGSVAGFLERVYPADGMSLEQVTRVENCKPGAVAADITLVVVRCYPTLGNQGNMPALEVTSSFAQDLNTDMAAVWNALKCCTGVSVAIRESAVDSDPEGGCSAFAIRVTTLVKMDNPAVVDES
jgi:hypothetical protein